MHYGIRGCGQAGPTQNLSDIGPHVAAFLLLRGEYAFLSTGWSGRSVASGVCVCVCVCVCVIPVVCVGVAAGAVVE
eukprot:SAG25_NODE_486_length_7469_cov_4.137449_10_plen_76_part_00